MRQYAEIVDITDSQNPEFNLIWEAEQLMRRNLFITTAEEHGLQRYERLLGITPMPHENFQARRNHILVRWNKTVPYTFRFLIGLLEVLTNGNFEVIPNFDVYEMEIRVFTLDSGIISDLAFILRHIIPANIALTSSNHVRINMAGFVVLPATMQTVRHYTITQDFNTKVTARSRFAAAGSVIRVTEYKI